MPTLAHMAYEPRPTFHNVNRSHPLIRGSAEYRTPGVALCQRVSAMLVIEGCPNALAREVVRRSFDLEWTEPDGWTLWLLGQGIRLEGPEMADAVIPELVRRVVDANEDERE